MKEREYRWPAQYGMSYVASPNFDLPIMSYVANRLDRPHTVEDILSSVDKSSSAVKALAHESFMGVSIPDMIK